MKSSEWRERARARLKGTTVLPGSCDKTRGAETLSAAAGAQLALLCDERQRADFFRTRTRSGSENIQQEQRKGTGGRAQLRARASARKIRHSARNKSGQNS